MSVARRSLPFFAVGAVSAWLAFTVTFPGADFVTDAGPVVRELAHGHLSALLHSNAIMGPFALIVEAPFVAIAGADWLPQYQWASLPGLIAVGLLGLYLAAIARRRGASGLSQLLIATLCLVNPITLEALNTGHPEELLTAALAVGAVASASEGRDRRAALLLGLAVASKQWALIAVFPVLMALPRPAMRLRTAVGAGAVAAVLILPGIIAAPGSFADVQGNAASTGNVLLPWSAWYSIGDMGTRVVTVGSHHFSSQVPQAPALVGGLSHPLIVILAGAIPLALTLRRGRFGITGADAMALLALLALLRCALDPVNNLYYHEPLLIALLGWDALASRGLPWRGLIGAAVAFAFRRWLVYLDPESFNAIYVAVAGAAALALGLASFGRGAEGSSDQLDVGSGEARIGSTQAGTGFPHPQF